MLKLTKQTASNACIFILHGSKKRREAASFTDLKRRQCRLLFFIILQESNALVSRKNLLQKTAEKSAVFILNN